MTSNKKIIVGILTGVLLSTSAFALENKKEGFMLSLGAGGALTSTDFSSTYKGWDTGKANTEFGYASSLKIGYGINGNYALYLFRSSAFVHGYSNDPDEKTYGNCVTGIGVNYYPDNSNYYFIGGVGMGQLSKLDEGENKAKRGYGGIVGVGYRYTEHVQLEANYLATRVDDDGVKLSTNAFQMTLNYYFY